MSKVVLSNGYEFELAANGYGSIGDSVHFTIISGEKTLEELEQIFNGVEEFKVIIGTNMDDPTLITNYVGYTRVQTLTKTPEYYNGVNPETGEPIYTAAATITCLKKAIEDRMTDVEDSIDDIVMTILGGDEVLADLGTEEESAPVEG